MSSQMLLGIGAGAVVLVVGLLICFLRASDLTSRAPIVCQKFDYGTCTQQTHQLDRPTQAATSAF